MKHTRLLFSTIMLSGSFGLSDVQAQQSFDPVSSQTSPPSHRDLSHRVASNPEVMADIQARMRPIGSSARTLAPAASYLAPRSNSLTSERMETSSRIHQMNYLQFTPLPDAGFSSPEPGGAAPGGIPNNGFSNPGSNLSLPGSSPQASVIPSQPAQDLPPQYQGGQAVAPPTSQGTFANPQTLAPTTPGFQQPNLSQQPNRGINNQQRHLPTPNTIDSGNGLGPSTVGAPITSSLDQAAISQPRLPPVQMATIDNYPGITGPSRYTAAMPYPCRPMIAPVSAIAAAPYAPPPAQIADPAVMPPPTLAAPVPTYPQQAIPANALVSFGQERYPVQVGQGLWGQPVAYVPGQSIRNWLRYFSP